jgi:hypothetical protein
VPHRVDQSDDIVLLDIDVLNGLFKEFLFRWHIPFRISMILRGPVGEM